MTQPFAVAEDVQRRLDFELDESQIDAVDLALEDMSDEARFIAGRGWPNAVDPPVIVKKYVIRAVQRWAQNMHGYVTSTASDETVQWTDLREVAGAPAFTEYERKQIKAAGTQRIGYFFGSVFASVGQQQRGPGGGWAQPNDGSKPFGWS